LDIVQKIRVPLRKLFGPPGVPSCLRACSRVADTLSLIVKSWHHASHSWGGFLGVAGVLEQQGCEQPP